MIIPASTNATMSSWVTKRSRDTSLRLSGVRGQLLHRRRRMRQHQPRAALGGAAAKLEHIAIRVESLPETLSELGETGVRFLHDEPVVTGPNLSAYTEPTTSAGMIFQLFAPKPEG